MLHFARDKNYYFFQRFDFFDPMNIKRSMMLSDRSPATPSTRTMLRQWYRRTLRPTSSPAPRTLTRPTRLARPMKRTRASRSSMCRIRTFWTPVRRMDRADAFCGPARLARRRRSPSTGGRPPLCARDGAWERSVSIFRNDFSFPKHRAHFLSYIHTYVYAIYIYFSLFFIFVKMKKKSVHIYLLKFVTLGRFMVN